MVMKPEPEKTNGTGRTDEATVLLAGATGTLGRALIPVLMAGHPVTALVRPASESKLMSSPSAVSSIRLGVVTDAETLRGACDGIATVVSTVGITRQRDRMTYEDVDLGANINLLREAERAGVKRFVYVSVVGADEPSSVPLIDAKHRFEQALMESSLEWIIIRPSGFFTDLLDVLNMAQRGKVYQFGDGNNRITPIHPADLADFIALNLTRRNEPLEVGGPESLTWNQISDLCFEAVAKKPRVIHLPRWLLQVSVAAVRPFSKYKHGVLSFVGHVQTEDTTAPCFGTRRLKPYLVEHLKRR